MGHVIMSSCQQQQNILTTQHVTRRSFIPDSRHTYSYVRTYVHTWYQYRGYGWYDIYLFPHGSTHARTHARCVYVYHVDRQRLYNNCTEHGTYDDGTHAHSNEHSHIIRPYQQPTTTIFVLVCPCVLVSCTPYTCTLWTQVRRLRTTRLQCSIFSTL